MCQLCVLVLQMLLGWGPTRPDLARPDQAGVTALAGAGQGALRMPSGGRSKISRWFTVGIAPCSGSTRTRDASPSTCV